MSHAIKALEEELECKLFTRTGKGVTVTPAGKHFLKYTDRILAHMEKVRTLVAPRTARGKERLRVGVSTRAHEFILPVIQPLFQKDFPNRLVVIEPGDYRWSLDLLGCGLLDLSFSVRPSGRPDLDYVHLFEDELRFIVSADHPWAQSGGASLDDLTGDMLLLFQDYNNTPQLLRKHLKAEGITPRHGVELTDYQSIKNVVRTGRAVGVLPLWLVADELRNETLVSLPIGGVPLVRQWGLACQSKRPLAPMDLRFIELCEQAVPGILSRLQGQSVLEHEKTGTLLPVIPVLEAEHRYGGVALLLMVLYNLMDGAMDWAGLGAFCSTAM